MTQWTRYDGAGTAGFGTLEVAPVAAHAGDTFASPPPTGRTVALRAVVVPASTAAGNTGSRVVVSIDGIGSRTHCRA